MTRRRHKKKRKNKAECQKRHFKRRMQERFGLSITDAVYYQMRGQVKNGGAKFLRKTNNRLSVFELTFQGHTMRVVYDSVNKTLVTALLPGQ